jgi:hypothetical protein
VSETLLVDVDKSLAHQTVKEALHATVKRMLVSAVQCKNDLADCGPVLAFPESLQHSEFSIRYRVCPHRTLSRQRLS